MTSACCGLALLAELVENCYFLKGERMLAADPLFSRYNTSVPNSPRPKQVILEIICRVVG